MTGSRSRSELGERLQTRERVGADGGHRAVVNTGAPLRLRAGRGRPHGLISCSGHSCTHPEGWRDWPYETPATSRKRDGANSIRLQLKAWEMWVGGFARPSPQTPAEVFSYAGEALQLQGVRADYPLEALYVCERCFGPLEVALLPRVGHPDPEELRRRIQGGPDHVALRRLPAARRRRPAVEPARSPAGCTPLVCADRLAEQLGLARGMGQERRGQPDALVQGPRRLGRARPRPRARLRGDGVRVDRQSRQRRRRARGRARTRVLRVHPRPTSRSRRSSPPASTAPAWSRSAATTTT